MSITKNTSYTKRSEQQVLNNSVDDAFDILAVEHMNYDPSGVLKRKTAENLSVRVAVDTGDGNVTYIGKATAGSSESDAVWQIQKVDETSGTEITWEDGNDNFDNKWSERESGSYS